MSIKIIIIKESQDQVLFSMSDGFYSTYRKYCRVLRAHNVLDIITHYERDIDLEEVPKILYESFYVKYESEDEGLIYILCYGDFRKFAELLLTGGILEPTTQKQIGL